MSIKTRLYRLKKRIARNLSQAGFDIIFPQRDPVFHIVAIYDNSVRYIFISLTEPRKEVVGLVRAAKRPGKKEIWWRKDNNELEIIAV